MSEASNGQDFLFLLRNTEWGHDMPPSEALAALESMLGWVEDMRARGIFRAGQPLSPAGRVIRTAKGAAEDGPFAETKEIVGGFIMVRTNSIEEAEQEARKCPVLNLGMYIEVRPLLNNCPLGDELGVQMLVASP